MQGVYVTLTVTILAILLKSCSQRPDMPGKRERVSAGVSSDSFVACNRAMTGYSSGATDRKNLNL